MAKEIMALVVSNGKIGMRCAQDTDNELITAKCIYVFKYHSVILCQI